MKNTGNPENIDEELKKREINRLITPLKYPKWFIGTVYDAEGKPVQPTISIWPARFKYILEPKIGILTDREVLKYAGESKTASKIRLKRGIDSFSDKTILHGNKILAIWLFIGLGGSLIFGSISFIIGLFFGKGIISALYALLFTLGIPTLYTIYILYLKNYIEDENEKEAKFIEDDYIESETINIDFSKNLSSFKTYKKQVHQIESLYQIKEKMARDLIEKRFSPPQLTYDRFIGAIDSCNTLFYNQAESALNLMEVSIEHTPKVDEELKNRLDTLKSIVKKIDELTNELAINLSDSEQSYSGEVKDLLDDMQKLVDSVKEYD
ncbi:MAG: hypothetical protein FWH29_07265 [Methanobrevibacter sp.]|nr:hypothetical protein [Methanobrevibacter sp.]